jgi:NO-binding membrane sensor protein with MHYT domain
MSGSHNLTLVALSYVISVFGSYTGLMLAGQIKDLRNGLDRLWLAFAAIALGGGAIWSMHFIAMLAYQSPITVTYDPLLTIGSMVVAILATGTGAYLVIRQPRLRVTTLIGAGVIMGLGVASMHYTGMAAMEMHGTMHHDHSIVAISIVIAIVASIAALWIAFTMREAWQKLLSALVMGVAVCGMHYTAMYGFTVAHVAHGAHTMTAPSGPTILPVELAGHIVAATVMVFVAALLSIFTKELREATR